jgi:CheY-like chemotaxis protein
MVHGLASQLGGELLISSWPGVGTNVELLLPISQTLPEGGAASVSRDLASSGAGRVVLVDDEELVRASTAAMLVELGYDVIEAASAEEALRMISGGIQLDVLVTDHLMPGMTGVDLARALFLRKPEVAVLIISGYAEAEGIAPDLPRLTKPFRITDLALSLASLLRPVATSL